MRKWLIILALVAVAALVVVGCGGGEENGSASSPAASESAGGDVALTAAEIQQKVGEAMEGMQSVAMDFTASLQVDGDASKATDEQTKALIGSPVALSAKGDVSNEPQKLDVTVDFQGMGQNLAIGLRMDGDQIWVQFMDKWYVVDQTMLQGMTGASPSPSATDGKLTDQIAELGFDPAKWVSEWTLVGEETLNGADVYHLTATIDIEQIATDLSGSLGSLGAVSGEAADPEDVKQAIRVFRSGLKEVSLDEYVLKDTFYLAKAEAKGTFDMSRLAEADREGAQGIDSVDFSGTIGLSNFDEPVTVEAPANPLPFTDLMNAIMQSGVLGSSLST